MKRRAFLTALPLSALAVQTANLSVFAQDAASDTTVPKSLIDSPPLLQNPGEDGMTVVWVITAPATGYVEYGETPDLGQKATTAIFGLNPYHDLFLQARMTGLRPNTKYYYKTVTVPVDFKSAYKIDLGTAVSSEIFSFVTPSANTETCDFSVINDTHQQTQTLVKLTQKLAELKADYTIWNGDLINDYYTDEQVVTNIARPADAAFAAERPLLFVRGNHDVRGPWARHLPQLLTPWSQQDPKYRDLGYNFAFRQGPLAIISLDTGEDKPDNHPVFSGLAQFEPYKRLQADWLAETLKRPDIASAPYIVVFCHIPLYDPRPTANGGDTLEGYAAYSRMGQQLWGGLLNDAGVQIVITAHQHHYRFDATNNDTRHWAHLVGGGTGNPGATGNNLSNVATLIHGKADKEKLLITAYDIDHDKQLGNFEFKPRS